MSNKKSLTLGLIAAGLFSAGSAVAGPLLTTAVSYNYSLSFGDPTQIIVIDGFDTSLGTLESVHLTLHVDQETLEGFAQVAGGGTGSVSGAFSTGTLTINGPAGLTVSNTLSTSPFTGTITGFGSLGSSSGVPADVSTVLLGNPVTLSAYLGPSTVSLSLSNSTVQQGTCVFPVSCGTNGSAAGTLIVQYDYSNNVPEPASLSLLGIGALGAGFGRRKAKAATA